MNPVVSRLAKYQAAEAEWSDRRHPLSQQIPVFLATALCIQGLDLFEWRGRGEENWEDKDSHFPPAAVALTMK